MLNLALCAILWSGALLPQAAPDFATEEVFENRRLRLRVSPPPGWRLVSEGSSDDEPIELWKEGEGGPRIQIVSFPFPLSHDSEIDDVQEELARALVAKFPSLDVGQESRLVHQGHPAIEVTATLPVEDTYYHVVQRSLFAGGRIYIITCASFESSFIYELPTFRSFLESIEILENGLDLASPNRRPPLVSSRILGAFGFSIVLLGFFLRQISARKLGGMALR